MYRYEGECSLSRLDEKTGTDSSRFFIKINRYGTVCDVYIRVTGAREGDLSVLPCAVLFVNFLE